jgi:DNA-binding GntR family transcriptional regulator
MTTTEPIHRQALYEEVADRLRKRIYSHALRPGEAIDEKALCAAFGISRTPLREALKVLHAEGLVQLIPRRGCTVRSIDLEELRELFPVVAVLEGLCAREAAQRCTAEDIAHLEELHADLEAHAAAHQIDDYYEANFRFHQAIQNLSGNRWLQRLTGDLRKILRLARHTQLTIPGRLESSLNEHRRIMDAFRKHDAQLVDQQMQEHLKRQWLALEQVAAVDNHGKSDCN